MNLFPSMLLNSLAIVYVLAAYGLGVLLIVQPSWILNSLGVF